MIELKNLDPRLFGLALRQLRIRAGFTLEQAAEQCGLDVATVTAFERGEQPPDEATLRQLGEAYPAPVDDIVNEVENQRALAQLRHALNVLSGHRAPAHEEETAMYQWLLTDVKWRFFTRRRMGLPELPYDLGETV